VLIGTVLNAAAMQAAFKATLGGLVATAELKPAERRVSVQRVEGRAVSAGGSIRCGPGSRSISSVIGGSSSSVLGTALHPASSLAAAFFLFFSFG
jgi:hypothetical protein